MGHFERFVTRAWSRLRNELAEEGEEVPPFGTTIQLGLKGYVGLEVRLKVAFL